MENKLTAVEWLEEKINHMLYNGGDLGEDAPALMIHINRAKLMEIIQIETAYDKGIEHQLNRYASTNSAKYFQETYGKEPKEFWIAISRCPKTRRIITTAIEEIVGESYIKKFVNEFNKTGIAEAGGLPVIKIIKAEI